MKLLMLGIDGLEHTIIEDNIHRYPNIKSLLEQGAGGTYFAFTNKGYTRTYGSHDNWTSIHTGVHPKDHKITVTHVGEEKRDVVMADYQKFRPFWDELNKAGYRIGMWAPYYCHEPLDVDGYVISCTSQPIDAPQEERTSPKSLQFSPSVEKEFKEIFLTQPPPRVYPKTIEQLGTSLEVLQASPEKAMAFFEDYTFSEALENFQEEVDYWLKHMKVVHPKHPVDVLYFFTATLDIMGHTCMSRKNHPTMVKAYEILDKFIGDLLAFFQPENVLLFSDHGERSLHEFVETTEGEIHKDLFTYNPKDVLWLPNDHVMYRAMNGYFMTAVHAINGFFVAKGKGIKKGTLPKGGRTLDIYPTILEIMDCPIPEEKEGFVWDIFQKPLCNPKKLWQEPQRKKVAWIQNTPMSIHDVLLNEFFIAHRFCEITVVAQAKYHSLHKNNERVAHCVTFEDFQAQDFQEIYTEVYHPAQDVLQYFKVNERCTKEQQGE